MSYMTFEELVQNFGIPKDTILYGCKRYRKNLSSSWENIKDRADKRRVLININTIPKGTCEKYNIPTGQEYIEQKRIQQEKQNQRQKELQANFEKTALVDAYNNDWIPYVSLYERLFSYSNFNQLTYSKPYAKEHAFWLKMVEITGTKYNHYHGKVQEGFKMYMDLRNELSFKTKITNLTYFRGKLKSIRFALANNQDISELIADGSMKVRPHNMKTNDFHNAITMQFLSHPKKYAYRVVTDLVNHHCELEGQKQITESWIKKKMAEDNQFKTTVNKYRNGEKFFKDNIMPHAVRKITPFPGNVWMIDGTPVQFFCWNESRTKTVRLNLFVIIDVCSRKIVGFDIAYSEDRFNVLESLKLAVLSEGHLPAEIVSDNFSANKTDEIKDIKEQMEQMGVVWRHSKINNPQDKSYVERFFGAFQTVECALYDDYIGEGITSKRLNARPNPEFLAKIAKEKGILSYKEMINRIGVIIAKYNERALKTMPTPNEVYKTFPKPNIVEMDSVKTALMFWNKTTHTVKRGMIKIKVRKTEHVFEIYEHTLKMQLQDKKVIVRYDENDMDTIMLFDENDRALTECKKSIRVNIASVDREEKDLENTYKVVAKQKSYSQFIDKYRDDLIEKGLKVVNKESVELVHPLSLAKNQVNSKESLDLLELFRGYKSLSEEDTRQEEYKPIGVMTARKTNETYDNLTQKKSPLAKGSLKVVGVTNRKI